MEEFSSGGDPQLCQKTKGDSRQTRGCLHICKMMTSQGRNHFFSHSMPLSTEPLQRQTEATPTTSTAERGAWRGTAIRSLCLHITVFASFPPPFQLAHSYHRFSSQEIIFGERCQKDMHSNNFYSFSDPCQPARQLHTLTRLLWPVVGSLWLIFLWHPALGKHRAGEEKEVKELIVVFTERMFLGMLFISVFFMSPARGICVEPRPGKAVLWSNWCISNLHTTAIS